MKARNRLARLVKARTFELIGDAGEVLARLVKTVENTTGELRLFHGGGGGHASAIQWTDLLSGLVSVWIKTPIGDPTPANVADLLVQTNVDGGLDARALATLRAQGETGSHELDSGFASVTALTDRAFGRSEVVISAGRIEGDPFSFVEVIIEVDAVTGRCNITAPGGLFLNGSPVT